VKRVFVVVVVVIALAGIAAAALVVRPWDPFSDGEATIRTATLRPGQIRLLLANDSEATTRVAQIILNDAFVDFRASAAAVKPGQTASITISYPWIQGESYDVELLTTTGASIDYEIEDAEAA
jgi:hypothetical protein